MFRRKIWGLNLPRIIIFQNFVHVQASATPINHQKLIHLSFKVFWEGLSLCLRGGEGGEEDQPPNASYLKWTSKFFIDVCSFIGVHLKTENRRVGSTCGVLIINGMMPKTGWYKRQIISFEELSSAVMFSSIFSATLHQDTQFTKINCTWTI